MGVDRPSPRPVPTFFVERYWPGVTLETFAEAVDRLGKTIDVLRAGGAAIHAATATFVPEDEAAYWVIDGPSQASVELAFEQAEIPIERIVPAFELRPVRAPRAVGPGSSGGDGEGMRPLPQDVEEGIDVRRR